MAIININGSLIKYCSLFINETILYCKIVICVTLYSYLVEFNSDMCWFLVVDVDRLGCECVCMRIK